MTRCHQAKEDTVLPLRRALLFAFFYLSISGQVLAIHDPVTGEIIFELPNDFSCDSAFNRFSFQKTATLAVSQNFAIDMGYFGPMRLKRLSVYRGGGQSIMIKDDPKYVASNGWDLVVYETLFHPRIGGWRLPFVDELIEMVRSNAVVVTPLSSQKRLRKLFSLAYQRQFDHSYKVSAFWVVEKKSVPSQVLLRLALIIYKEAGGENADIHTYLVTQTRKKSLNPFYESLDISIANPPRIPFHYVGFSGPESNRIGR